MDSIGPKLNLQMVDAPAAGLTRADIEALRVRVAGDVVAPGDPEWDDARQAWNLAVDQWPAAVALPENAQDVAEVVALAAEAGVQVAPQGTGHNAAALGSLDDTILLKTERMRGVTIDPAAASTHLGKANRAAMRDLRDTLAALPEWNLAAIEAAFQGVLSRHGLALGKLAQPVRVALTGGTVSPGIYEVAEVVGQARVVARLDAALPLVGGEAAA